MDRGEPRSYPGHDTSYCTGCGLCCMRMPLSKKTPDGRTVWVTKKDVEAWRRAGYLQFAARYGPIPIYAGRGKGRHSYFRCGHLVRQGNQWLCAIYERRPAMCRAYPLVIDESLPVECGYRALLPAPAAAAPAPAWS